MLDAPHIVGVAILAVAFGLVPRKVARGEIAAAFEFEMLELDTPEAVPV